MIVVRQVFEEDAVGDGPQRQIDYQLCGFEGTRLKFRGPAPDLNQPFTAILGGNEVFGKYVEQPFPGLIAEWTGTPVLNLGVCQAGLSLFSEERWLLDAASWGNVTVIQVLGAQNMSNRLYSVHSRRNDRFLGVSPALRDIFPTVDFAEINFTGHLFDTLSRYSSASFDVLVDELKWAWVQRMRRILSTIRNDVLLLWISDRRPEDTKNTIQECEPLFVDRDMLDALGSQICGVIEVVCPLARTLDGKTFPKREEDAARSFPGPVEHSRIAEAVVDAFSKIPKAPGRVIPPASATGS